MSSKIKHTFWFYALIVIAIFAFAGCAGSSDGGGSGTDSSTDTSSTEYKFSDGDSYVAPEGVSLKSIATGDFSGVNLYAGDNYEVSGFVSKTDLQASTGETSANGILTSAVDTLDGTSDVSSITAISVSSNAALKARLNIGQADSSTDSDDVVFGSYNVTTYSSMCSDALSRIALMMIGLSDASGDVSFSTEATGDATTDFRLFISLSYTSTETLVIVVVVPEGSYSSYEGLINQTVQVDNVQESGETRADGSDSFTVADQSSKADFLFVVDNSGSMSEEQTAISDNATRFFTKLTNKGLDFKIGVITTDSSTLAGTGFTSDQTEFESNIMVGTNGSYNESGIYHAEEAVSTGGSVPTAGYPRTGATLAVIIVSDEEDQYTYYSGGTEFNFTDNVFTQNNYTVHAIVSDPDSGCSGTGGSASGSEDYPTLATNTGGAKGSICQSDYSATLDTIISGGGQTFTLDETPIVSTIVVKVNGTAIPVKTGDDGYLYLSSTNSITFYGTAIPEAGDTVAVTYKYLQ